MELFSFKEKPAFLLATKWSHKIYGFEFFPLSGACLSILLTEKTDFVSSLRMNATAHLEFM